MKYFPQYNRKFICVGVKSKHPQPLHNAIIGAVCYPAYVKEGERAWILVAFDEGKPHRLHTSNVIGTYFEEITSDEVVTGYRFTIETENTEYVFETPYKDNVE